MRTQQRNRLEPDSKGTSKREQNPAFTGCVQEDFAGRQAGVGIELSQVRLERVLELRHAISEGRYHVSAEQVADALLRHAYKSEEDVSKLYSA